MGLATCQRAPTYGGPLRAMRIFVTAPGATHAVPVRAALSVVSIDRAPTVVDLGAFPSQTALTRMQMKLSRTCQRLAPFALLSLLTLAGCDDASSLLENSAPRTEPSLASSATAVRLHVGDKIKVVIIGDDKISGEYEIDQSGEISVPAAGALRAAGRTKNELESEIARKLTDQQYLRNPMVTVDVSMFRPFYVLGEVEKPGEYPYHTGLNILSAMAVAGGETYRGNESHALIQRAGEPDFHEYSLSPNVPIYPGDLIKVPERYF